MIKEKRLDNKTKMAIMNKRMAARSNFSKDFIESIGDELFYDQFTGNFFNSNKAAILAAELVLNRDLYLNGFTDICRFYDTLGVGPFAIKPICGWRLDNGVVWIDIDKVYMEDDKYAPNPYHLLSFIPGPENLYTS